MGLTTSLQTFIGKVAKGFDWLGHWFTLEGLVGPAPRALSNFAGKLRQLYEQARKRPSLREGLELRVARYVKRWQQWLGYELTIDTLLFLGVTQATCRHQTCV